MSDPEESKDPITTELIARIAIELAKLPRYDNRPLKSLVGDAYDFLMECQKIVQTHKTGSYSYLEAIRRVTGYTRIRKQQIETFERFYIVTHPQWENGDREPEVEEYLDWLKKTDSVPLSVCTRLALIFPSWLKEDRRKTKKKS